jgi:hypothetical protein
MPAPKVSRPGVLVLLALLSLGGCSRDEQSGAKSTFYSRKIGPLLEQSCATSPTRSSCHVKADARGNALGNLSVESYDDLYLRKDLLVNYGPYGMPGLLLKVVPNLKLSLTSYRSKDPLILTTDIVHAGNRQIDTASPTFTTLEKWMVGGAAENNAPQTTQASPLPGCSDVLGEDPLFDATKDPTAADFATFRNSVNPILGERCAAGNCHGSAANSLHLTCGATAEQVRWNYFAAGDYVSADPRSSEILLRTLSPTVGGSYHEGGPFWSSVDDENYKAILAWATEKGGPSQVPTDPGFDLFATRVQPMLVKRGCMMLGCHSAAMFHDYRLRGGSGGHFGLPATRRNYRLTLEQLALESPDPNESRLIAKNLIPGEGGMLHRGGPLFAANGRPEACDLAAAETGPLDDQAPYCVIVAWIAKERATRMAGAAALSAVVDVKRAPRPLPDTLKDWETFAAGADVVSAAVTPGAAGALAVGAETSLSRLCGLDPATSDARRPAVSWDGSRVAFSARTGANAPYRIYVVSAGACAVEPAIDAAPVDARGGPLATNGELVHNFDPSFSPDDRIVFVSTRGNLVETGQLSFPGPRRTPADPSKLNTNLYVRDSDGSIRQLTFLLNQEMLPSFMRDGRVILTTEKRAPNFYQLAGRRINLDGGDYHPLFGQRSTVGFDQFSGVVELSDKNLAAIFSERGAAHGAGALAIINRSIGIDQRSKNPSDYLVDPDAISFPNEGFYQHSIQILDSAASGRLSSTQGAYASPSPLPDGRLLASYAAGATNLATFNGGFDVVVVNPNNGARSVLIPGPEDALWPVAVYAKQNIGVFRSRLDEANGATALSPKNGTRAEITYLDLPLLTTLLFQNTRSGRDLPVDQPHAQVWQDLPPEPGVTSFATGGSFVTNDSYGQLYVRRSLIGEIAPARDGSARVALPGGIPYLLAMRTQLASDTSPTLHFQREQMQAYPGEVVRQSFRRDFFNGLCGGCHGSVSGLENHVAINPDILTQASVVEAREGEPLDLVGAVPGAPEGPEFP